MIEFTAEELHTLSNALDMMVRAEGNGLVQNGIAVLRTNNVSAVLASRLAAVVSAAEKIDAEVVAMADAAGNTDKKD